MYTMNVLLIYPELPLSFWSFKFASRLSGKRALFPPLGLITVAGLLPHEWNLRLVDLNSKRMTQIDWAWPDMVMISAMVAQSKDLPQLVKRAKDSGAIVVMGGPYPTSLSKDVLEMGCDFAVRGEAENTIPQLLDGLKKNKARVVLENELKPDLSQSPIPRFDLLRLKDYVNFSVQTSRGCPFECEFCDVTNLLGRKPRYKNPDQVVLELEALYGLGVRGHLFICDDNFIGDKRRAREFLQKIMSWNREREEPFSFGTQTSINLGQDLALIDLMTRANFGEVFVGIETPDERVLEHAGKVQNVRIPLIESLDNICKNGLTVQGSFIIGFDGEERGAGKRICDLVDTTSIPVCMLNTLHAPPNTRLWQRLEKEGRLLQRKLGGEEGTFSTPNFVPTRPMAEILKEYVDAWSYLYDPSRYLDRTYKYHLKMRPTRRAIAISKGKAPPSGMKDRNISLKTRLREFLIFFQLSWRQGIRPPYRIQFWRQLFDMWKRNPSRIHKYLICCVMGEDLFQIRDLISKNMECASRNPPVGPC
jgi:radical SAM superfamily enzyme YgiQ (UPF0313 family)